MKRLSKKSLISSKITFCPGPGANIPEWTKSQKEYFGRGDKEYENIKSKTINWLKKISQKNEVVPVAGSASTAAIISFETFLKGKVLLINTGYYSNRWLKDIKARKNINLINIDYKNIENINGRYNWIVFVYVETSSCIKFDLKKVFKLKKKLKSKLLLDATASIGLENNHKLADVMFFSSCKGLFGPTGLGFIAHEKSLKKKLSNNFLLNIDTHKDSKYTLGYNCMSALYEISSKHDKYKKKIIYASNYLKQYTILENSPLIGCGLKNRIKNKKIKNTIFYQPREIPPYDVIFLLGLIKLNYFEIKKVLNKRILLNLVK